jgi:hypothetical protein
LFDCNYYTNQLPVFIRNTIEPLEHYLRAGWALGLSPHVAFDSAFLAEQLGITEWTEPPLITYFENPIEISPHALFSADVYGRSVKLDVSKYARLFEMFLDSWSEARAPFSHFFCLRYYEEWEPVIRSGRTNPLLHCLMTELARRRDANPMIHNRWYDLRYPAKPGQPCDPLVRFARFGLREGHLPNPFARRELKILGSDGYIPRDLLLQYVDTAPADRKLDGLDSVLALRAPDPFQETAQLPAARNSNDLVAPSHYKKPSAARNASLESGDSSERAAQCATDWASSANR